MHDLQHSRISPSDCKNGLVVVTTGEDAVSAGRRQQNFVRVVIEVIKAPSRTKIIGSMGRKPRMLCLHLQQLPVDDFMAKGSTLSKSMRSEA